MLGELVDAMVDVADDGGVAMSSAVVRMYSLPIGLVAMVGLLTIEWILRRRWQLR